MVTRAGILPLDSPRGEESEYEFPQHAVRERLTGRAVQIHISVSVLTLPYFSSHEQIPVLVRIQVIL